MKKSNKKIKAPKRSGLTYLILIGGLIILILAIFIPLSYVKEYNDNKVIPFESDLTDISVEKGKLSTIDDFNLVVYCSEYKDIKDTDDQNNLSSAVFKYYVYKNDKTDELKVKNVKLRLALCADWIKVNQSSTVRSLTMYETEEKGIAGVRSITLSGLPDMPKKGNLPFINVESIPLYVYLQYDVTVNGQTQTKYFILTLTYSEYIAGATGGIEK